MKRDMDLIRELLLYTEEHSRPELGAAITENDLELCKTRDHLLGHINLLIDGGIMTIPHHSQSNYYLGNLTSYGHDFLDSIRNPEIWRQTQEATNKVGGWTLEFVGEIAKGFLKRQLEKHTGLELSS